MSLTNEQKLARLERSLAFGGATHDVADLVELIKANKAQFWSYKDGLIVTEIREFPKTKSVHFWLVSGVLADCLALEEDVISWAYQEGCAMATATGRKGWARAAAGIGWKPHGFTFYKDIPQGSAR